MRNRDTVVKIESRFDDPVFEGRRFYTVCDKRRKYRQMQGLPREAERELDSDLFGYFLAKREHGYGAWVIGKRVWDHVWD